MAFLFESPNPPTGSARASDVLFDAGPRGAALSSVDPTLTRCCQNAHQDTPDRLKRGAPMLREGPDMATRPTRWYEICTWAHRPRADRAVESKTCRSEDRDRHGRRRGLARSEINGRRWCCIAMRDSLWTSLDRDCNRRAAVASVTAHATPSGAVTAK